jgi:F0F1-type ATP synthase membrane subunit c/vacuolar-type H+-ATPase subunit K
MIEERQRVFTIIYLALVSSLGIYGFLAFQVFAKQPGAGALEPIFAYALMGMGVMVMLTIPFLRRMMMPPTREANSLSEALPPPGAAVSQAFARLFTASIITWALCESIAIFGLVLVVMSHDPRYYAGFAGVSLLNFIVYRPSGELLRSVARAAASDSAAS